jgi:UDP-glucose 4-epimerase
MRIVVTGGAGFIGKHLLDQFVTTNHDVLVVDDFSIGKPQHVPPGVDVFRADLASVAAEELGRCFAGFGAEAVIHLAGIHFIPDCMRRPEQTFAINTRSTHTLIEAIQRAKISRVVAASTMDVYAPLDRVHGEDDAPEPCNIYGLTKALNEQLLAYAVRSETCETAVALRLANVYGPNETNPHVIPDILDRIANRSAPVLTMGYLGSTRDFVYVGDVAAAFKVAALKAPSGYHVWNVGTGHPTSVRTIARMLQQIHGDQRPIQENPRAFRKFDRPSLTPRVEAIERALGWRAETGLADGLALTAASRSLEQREQAA